MAVVAGRVMGEVLACQIWSWVGTLPLALRSSRSPLHVWSFRLGQKAQAGEELKPAEGGGEVGGRMEWERGREHCWNRRGVWDVLFLQTLLLTSHSALMSVAFPSLMKNHFFKSFPFVKLQTTQQNLCYYYYFSLAKSYCTWNIFALHSVVKISF